MYQSYNLNIFGHTQIDCHFPTRLLPKPSIIRELELNNYDLSEIVFKIEFSQEEKIEVSNILLKGWADIIKFKQDI